MQKENANNLILVKQNLSIEKQEAFAVQLTLHLHNDNSINDKLSLICECNFVFLFYFPVGRYLHAGSVF